jgi:hypothetical protein
MTHRDRYDHGHDEHDALLLSLARQRDALRVIAYGLNDDQAHATPRPGGPSIHSLVELATRTERGWVARIVPERTWPVLFSTWSEHRAAPGNTLDEALRAYAGAAVATADAVAEVELSQPVAVPEEWAHPEVRTVREVVLTLIEQTARIVGHADIVREGVDGTSFSPLALKSVA